MNGQLPLLEPCPRCGRRIQLDLAQAATLAVRNGIELDRMRLAVPDRLKLGIMTLALALPCLAGTCSKEAQP